MKKTLLTLLAGLMLASTSVLYTSCQPKSGTFEIGEGKFLLNGDSFTVKAAEVHYPRIPREYWEHRIEMCKALGMNSICIYIFWNIHEQQEGVYDFTGNNDIRAFCQLAQKHGMYVIVRPGPYVCAEWEMGGLPWWLLKKKDIRLREQDPYFMERVRLFELEVGKQLADLQITHGGNIIMVQVENEYGSYGEDKAYVSAVRDMVREAGFTDVPLFQCDWASNFELNALDDLVWTMNFGTGANIDSQFRRLKELRPNTPLMCSEFWSGWFDNWGRQHETRDAKDMVAGLQEMLDKNISFSLYMTHGGTSCGHWSGANSPGFSPDCSSYDYDAPINEAGQATPKYHELRNMLAQYTDGKPLPEIPAAMPVQSVAEFLMSEVAPIFDNLPEPIHSEGIKTMEEYDQGWGSMLYRTTLKGTDSQSRLTITDAHDYAQVFVDGKYIGKMDRRLGEKVLTLPSVREGAVLDILVPKATITLTPVKKPRENAAVAADIAINNQACGFFARLSLEKCRTLGLPMETYYAELDLRKLQQIATAPFKAADLPQFPGSSRDASLDVPAATRHADIVKAVESAKQKLLISCGLKDVFCDPTGEKLAADRKAMTYTFLYRDAKKTLTAAEVDAAHKTVLDALSKGVKELNFR